MIYRIFPEKDATIYSNYPQRNTGIDEILEINANRNPFETSVIARSLIKFSQSEILDIINNKISGSFEVNLRLFLADANEIPTEYTILCYPVSQSWEMGLGRYSNYPETTEGVSWASRSLSEQWSSAGGTYYPGTVSTQSFVYNDNKDLNISVKNIISLWTGSTDNDGFILKHSSSLEDNLVNNLILKYFSKDTHTIYPPCLEFKWNDIIYNTGSFGVISNSNMVINLANNKQIFNQNSIQKFKFNVRDKYPTRTFQTSSVYLNYKLLPSSSYYAIRDLNTKEMVIDFDTNYTKIGADGTNNYFSINMSGLEPERYYQLLFKTVINDEIIVIDDDEYYFKISR